MTLKELANQILAFPDWAQDETAIAQMPVRQRLMASSPLTFLNGVVL